MLRESLEPVENVTVSPEETTNLYTSTSVGVVIPSLIVPLVIKRASEIVSSGSASDVPETLKLQTKELLSLLSAITLLGSITSRIVCVPAEKEPME